MALSQGGWREEDRVGSKARGPFPFLTPVVLRLWVS